MKNNYSSFVQDEEMHKELNKVSSKKEIKKGGIPLSYDDNSLYIDETYGHSLAIGSTGSGKTQTIILPKIWTSIIAGENLIVDDLKNELYDKFASDLQDSGYKIMKFDFNNYNGNKWNPIKLAFELYKDNNLDDAVMILEKVAYYIFNDSNDNNADPFWINCVRQLFVGTILYIMEKEDRLPTIMEVANYASKITVDSFNALSDESPAKIFLRVIMTAPVDTRGSIYSVFNNSIMCYAYSNNTTDFLSESDFNIEDVLSEKTVLFILDGHKKSYVTNLISLFIEELYYVCEKKKNNGRINIILDEFNDFNKIDNFAKLLLDTRYLNMEFTIITNSLHKLNEMYGETSLEHIISHFVRIIYLFAADEYTLDYISNMCGNKNVDERLISSTELKLFKLFDALVLKNRRLPYKTKLLPFYMYNIK